ncbi:hypothetical protein SAMN04487974_12339 [Pelagibacterium luteolum]|uniref:Uncharacterized protein n=1 Tax=Pelagibacterium luteolum TaxID=440168 RepID=A0A1G7ZWM4_9HYPH|nr:hypothetical protein SAMN04487974_12339 [Pelagibacterium luteolum]
MLVALVGHAECRSSMRHLLWSGYVREATRALKNMLYQLEQYGRLQDASNLSIAYNALALSLNTLARSSCMRSSRRCSLLVALVRQMATTRMTPILNPLNWGLLNPVRRRTTSCEKSQGSQSRCRDRQGERRGAVAALMAELPCNSKLRLPELRTKHPERDTCRAEPSTSCEMH